jgi:hypothetical protein
MIGYEPLVEKMVVITGQDFSHFFGVEPDDPFPAGTGVTLRIFDRESNQIGAWPAVTVQPGGAQVQITAEDLDLVPDASVFRVHVEYADGTDLIWYRGRVWRRN